MSQSKSKHQFALDTLHYYFDALDRDRFDQGAPGRKAAQCLELRERLMRLPSGSFDQAIKAIHAVVDTYLDSDLSAVSQDQSLRQRQKSAQNLYQEYRHTQKNSGHSNAPIDSPMPVS